MEILIVGAGLAGLTAAICLARKGHHVKVIERKEHLWAIGGAINLTAGASALLHKLGLQEKLAAVSDHTNLACQRDLLSGTVFRSIPLSIGNKVSGTTLRTSLLNLLFDEATRLGVPVHFSSTVVDLAETSTSATVTLEDGSTEHADLIIAADGVRSRMRPRILRSSISDPSQLDPVHSDRIYYVMNFTANNKLNKLDALSEASILRTPNCLNFWAGRDDCYAISLYNPSAENLSVLYCVREPVDMTTLWDEAGDVTYLRDKFAGKCHPELERALFAAEGCERWRLSQMPDLPRWCSPAGRMVLLGDAAHAMHPTAGQGYSSTVEELAVLGHLLESYPNEIAEATGLWEEICKPRSNRLKAFAHFLSRQYEGDQEALMQAAKGGAREAELDKTDPDRKGVKSDMNAGFAEPEFVRWVRDYDALKLAEDHIKKRGERTV